MNNYTNKLIKYPRGSVWMCNLSQVKAIQGVQTGNRPVVIMSSNIGNITSSSVVVVLITSNSERSRHSINVPFINDTGENNVVLGNQVHTVNKEALLCQIGLLPDSIIYEIEIAINEAFGIQRKEATIIEIDKSISKLIEVYSRKIEMDRQNEIIKQSEIDSVAKKLEQIFKDIVIPLERGKETAPLLTSYCKSGVENSHESPKELQEGSRAEGFTKKTRGFWTDARKIEYMKDKDSMTLQELAAKWNMQSTKTAYQMYYQFKRHLKK